MLTPGSKTVCTSSKEQVEKFVERYCAWINQSMYLTEIVIIRNTNIPGIPDHIDYALVGWPEAFMALD
jgi:hypothetical protein